jgi:hypothetical protein
MNNEELTRALKIINDAAISGQDFVLEQAPLIVQEIVTWHIASSAVYIILCVLFLWFVLKPLYKKWLTLDDSDAQAVLFAPLFVLIVLCSVTFICKVSSLTKGLTAPRLVVIDYAKEALK